MLAIVGFFIKSSCNIVLLLNPYAYILILFSRNGSMFSKKQMFHFVSSQYLEALTYVAKLSVHIIIKILFIIKGKTLFSTFKNQCGERSLHSEYYAK